jgi:glutaminyl-tRNA synthetase
MGVLNPLKVVIENYPEDEEEFLTGINNPENPDAGSRQVPFSRELYIEREDFMEDPPKKFFRLAPGREVRLRYAYFVTCTEVVKDASGEVTELRCTYDPATRGGDSPDGRKVKGTLHWVSAKHAIAAEVRHYDTLFNEEEPNLNGEGGLKAALNPASLNVIEAAQLEPALAASAVGEFLQLERTGYYCVDPDSAPGKVVLNRTATLRDTWAKVKKKAAGNPPKKKNPNKQNKKKKEKAAE